MKRGAVHRVIRAAYGAIPFKRHLYLLLRRCWRPNALLAEHLWFTGAFTVPVAAGRSFRMVNFGHQLETLVFWRGLIGDWEPVSMSAWVRACEGRNVVLDIGANTGLFALVAKTICPGAEVHCFEPMPRVLSRLQRNDRINGFGLHVHPVALSDHQGMANLRVVAGDHGYLATLEVDERGSGPGIVVPVRRLDQVLAEQGLTRVDLLKIDVEHHEPSVLRGMGHYLRQLPTILIEVLDADAANGIEDAIAGLGYLKFQVDEKGRIDGKERIVAMDAAGGRGYNYILCREEEAVRLGLITVDAALPMQH